jgi:light-regulated signal transduction histidine kinase (bacteriophytochrome)
MGIDISDRKRAETEVHRLNVELEQRVIDRTIQLETANKELAAFSYSVSHDLRAPLRAINGFAEIVLADFGATLPEEGQRLLKRIRNRALGMGHLIDDLLAFSSLGRQPLSRRYVNMRELAATVVKELTSHVEGREIEVHLGELPNSYCDAVLMQQVWVNLLSNAIKYSRERNPAIIEIGYKTENGEGIYFVRDNGAGFDMQFAHKLFRVFQRLHLADEFEGTGVGLAIVQRVIERHGGRVWAYGEEDRGATFNFTLPSPQAIP